MMNTRRKDDTVSPSIGPQFPWVHLLTLRILFAQNVATSFEFVKPTI
jgi:hypothetical protein